MSGRNLGDTMLLLGGVSLMATGISHMPHMEMSIWLSFGIMMSGALMIGFSR